ncbi:class I SAM-dependent methyltransferase [Ferruginivarius sediminum]|uniref:Class I SAM-dependent methyltransferase n=1 Tax=Ferruginivarius sediminum TaxID=2661937 RepID=A0A369TCI7_9PROT|nr:class I SAM-dependent methyltransferase [Ferruginivarius sediminum]RDD62998.1 class I SAM-dependent methyltransferase [Ferruginivarius sediminum]
MNDGGALQGEQRRREDTNLQPAWNDVFPKLTAFRQSLVIIAAAELGYFDVVSDLESVADISKRLNVSEVGASVIVNALSALGMVEEAAGYYKVRPDIARLFTPNSGHDIRYNIVALKKEVEVWSRMAGIMRGDSERDLEYSRELFDGGIKKFEGLGLLNRIDAEQILPHIVPHVQPRFNVLDIGGGEGYYAKRLCELTPVERVDILDIRTGFSISEEVNANALTGGRVRHIPGDARDFEVAAQYDVVLMNELLELFREDEKYRILENALSALKAGGFLVVTKFPLNPEGTGPGRFPLFSVRMHMKFEEAFLESDKVIVDWLVARGIEVVDIVRLNRTLMIFQKPRG